MSKDRWIELLSHKRFRASSVPVQGHWNPFDSDYSRISLSAPFRRLQDKAQVFPLDNNDFVRTRLTHSIEVSGIGRSLGVKIENELIAKGLFPDEKRGHIPSILAVSGLTHDIGNPPFGHFGEAIIQSFFRNFFDKKDLGLSKAQLNDFIYFDGNVQSFRLLLRLGLSKDEFSFNLTFPSLATMVKYPKDSVTGNKPKNIREAENLGISFKKFGYFQAEKDRFEAINHELKLQNSRHPLCFILEASDDICYSVSDIEDGVAKNIVPISDVKTLLKSKKDPVCNELHDKICKLERQLKKHPNRVKLIAQEIRIAAQQKMIGATISTFLNRHDDILACNFDGELIEASDAAGVREVFSDIGKICFAHESVVKRELLGNTVLKYLLETFVGSALSKDCGNPKTADGKIYSLISSRFRHIAKQSGSNSIYSKLLMVTDYISGMTDSFAVDLYNNLIGIEVK